MRHLLVIHIWLSKKGRGRFMFTGIILPFFLVVSMGYLVFDHVKTKRKLKRLLDEEASLKQETSLLKSTVSQASEKLDALSCEEASLKDDTSELKKKVFNIESQIQLQRARRRSPSVNAVAGGGTSRIRLDPKDGEEESKPSVPSKYSLSRNGGYYLCKRSGQKYCPVCMEKAPSKEIILISLAPNEWICPDCGHLAKNTNPRRKARRPK